MKINCCEAVQANISVDESGNICVKGFHEYQQFPATILRVISSGIYSNSLLFVNPTLFQLS